MSDVVLDVRTIFAMMNLRKSSHRGTHETSDEVLRRHIVRSVFFAVVMMIALFIVFSIMDSGHISKHHAAIVWLPLFVGASVSAARSYIFIRRSSKSESASLHGPEGEPYAGNQHHV